ncbi:MAG: hypothetical protein GY787_25515 [Alteromonadales bacterium]|nr:hypothetical protein [Alteromonadales bacterium]MCP4986987.1 hypothetical protein [Colwellia sp.]
MQNQCTPTRSALHIGRLPIRTGNQKVPASGEPDGILMGSILATYVAGERNIDGLILVLVQYLN